MAQQTLQNKPMDTSSESYQFYDVELLQNFDSYINEQSINDVDDLLNLNFEKHSLHKIHKVLVSEDDNIENIDNIIDNNKRSITNNTSSNYVGTIQASNNDDDNNNEVNSNDKTIEKLRTEHNILYYQKIKKNNERYKIILTTIKKQKIEQELKKKKMRMNNISITIFKAGATLTVFVVGTCLHYMETTKDLVDRLRIGVFRLFIQGDMTLATALIEGLCMFAGVSEFYKAKLLKDIRNMDFNATNAESIFEGFFESTIKFKKLDVTDILKFFQTESLPSFGILQNHLHAFLKGIKLASNFYCYLDTTFETVDKLLNDNATTADIGLTLLKTSLMSLKHSETFVTFKNSNAEAILKLFTKKFDFDMFLTVSDKNFYLLRTFKEHVTKDHILYAGNVVINQSLDITIDKSITVSINALLSPSILLGSVDNDDDNKSKKKNEHEKLKEIHENFRVHGKLYLKYGNKLTDTDVDFILHGMNADTQMKFLPLHYVTMFQRHFRLMLIDPKLLWGGGKSFTAIVAWFSITDIMNNLPAALFNLFFENPAISVTAYLSFIYAGMTHPEWIIRGYHLRTLFSISLKDVLMLFFNLYGFIKTKNEIDFMINKWIEKQLDYATNDIVMLFEEFLQYIMISYKTTNLYVSLVKNKYLKLMIDINEIVCKTIYRVIVHPLFKLNSKKYVLTSEKVKSFIDPIKMLLSVQKILDDKSHSVNFFMNLNREYHNNFSHNSLFDLFFRFPTVSFKDFRFEQIKTADVTDLRGRVRVGKVHQLDKIEEITNINSEFNFIFDDCKIEIITGINKKGEIKDGTEVTDEEVIIESIENTSNLNNILNKLRMQYIKNESRDSVDGFYSWLVEQYIKTTEIESTLNNETQNEEEHEVTNKKKDNYLNMGKLTFAIGIFSPSPHENSSITWDKYVYDYFTSATKSSEGIHTSDGKNRAASVIVASSKESEQETRKVKDMKLNELYWSPSLFKSDNKIQSNIIETRVIDLLRFKDFVKRAESRSYTLTTIEEYTNLKDFSEVVETEFAYSNDETLINLTKEFIKNEFYIDNNIKIEQSLTTGIKSNVPLPSDVSKDFNKDFAKLFIDAIQKHLKDSIVLDIGRQTQSISEDEEEKIDDKVKKQIQQMKLQLLETDHGIPVVYDRSTPSILRKLQMKDVKLINVQGKKTNDIIELKDNSYRYDLSIKAVVETYREYLYESDDLLHFKYEKARIESLTEEELRNSLILFRHYPKSEIGRTKTEEHLTHDELVVIRDNYLRFHKAELIQYYKTHNEQIINEKMKVLEERAFPLIEDKVLTPESILYLIEHNNIDAFKHLREKDIKDIIEKTLALYSTANDSSVDNTGKIPKDFISSLDDPLYIESLYRRSLYNTVGQKKFTPNDIIKIFDEDIFAFKQFGDKSNTEHLTDVVGFLKTSIFQDNGELIDRVEYFLKKFLGKEPWIASDIMHFTDIFKERSTNDDPNHIYKDGLKETIQNMFYKKHDELFKNNQSLLDLDDPNLIVYLVMELLKNKNTGNADMNNIIHNANVKTYQTITSTDNVSSRSVQEELARTTYFLEARTMLQNKKEEQMLENVKAFDAMVEVYKQQKDDLISKILIRKNTIDIQNTLGNFNMNIKQQSDANKDIKSNTADGEGIESNSRKSTTNQNTQYMPNAIKNEIKNESSLGTKTKESLKTENSQSLKIEEKEVLSESVEESLDTSLKNGDDDDSDVFKTELMSHLHNVLNRVETMLNSSIDNAIDEVGKEPDKLAITVENQICLNHNVYYYYNAKGIVYDENKGPLLSAESCYQQNLLEDFFTKLIDKLIFIVHMVLKSTSSLLTTFLYALLAPFYGQLGMLVVSFIAAFISLFEMMVNNSIVHYLRISIIQNKENYYDEVDEFLSKFFDMIGSRIVYLFQKKNNKGGKNDFFMTWIATKLQTGLFSEFNYETQSTESLENKYDESKKRVKEIHNLLYANPKDDYSLYNIQGNIDIGIDSHESISSTITKLILKEYTTKSHATELTNIADNIKTQNIDNDLHYKILISYVIPNFLNFNFEIDEGSKNILNGFIKEDKVLNNIEFIKQDLYALYNQNFGLESSLILERIATRAPSIIDGLSILISGALNDKTFEDAMADHLFGHQSKTKINSNIDTNIIRDIYDKLKDNSKDNSKEFNTKFQKSLQANLTTRIEDLLKWVIFIIQCMNNVIFQAKSYLQPIISMIFGDIKETTKEKEERKSKEEDVMLNEEEKIKRKKQEAAEGKENKTGEGNDKKVEEADNVKVYKYYDNNRTWKQWRDSFSGGSGFNKYAT